MNLVEFVKNMQSFKYESPIFNPIPPYPELEPPLAKHF